MENRENDQRGENMAGKFKNNLFNGISKKGANQTGRGDQINSDPEAKKALLTTIEGAMEQIKQIKQYYAISKDPKVKEKSIKESIRENLVPVNTPAKKEMVGLLRNVDNYLKTKGSLSDKQKEDKKELKLIGFKLKAGLASHADLMKVVEKSGQASADVKKEILQAIKDNVHADKLKKLESHDSMIGQSFLAVENKIRNHKIISAQESMNKAVVTFDKRLDYYEKESLKKKGDKFIDGLPPKQFDQRAERLVGFVKNLLSNSSDKKDPLKENSIKILDKVENSFNRDKRINNYDGRNKERRSLVGEVVKFSEETKNDLDKSLKKSQNNSLKPAQSKLGALINDAKQIINGETSKNRVINIIMENARKIKFEQNQKTKKQKMGKH